uniref:Uncharacterized protein n=1 Tax=viral metagenome TaxID=1070528 RepID=A0A6C0CGP8_9ZZZZ
MATVPVRRNFTRRKRRFSYVEKYEPSSQPRVNGDESEDYSSADEVDIDTVDPRQVALDARREEENRSILEKAVRKAEEDQKKAATQRMVVTALSPRKPATFTFKRRGVSGGRGAKKHTKKQVKRARNHKQNKTTKRQPKRRN